MTFEIAIVLTILVVSLILFISEVIRMDVVALMVLGALAIFGVVTAEQAFAGLLFPAHLRAPTLPRDLERVQL